MFDTILNGNALASGLSYFNLLSLSIITVLVILLIAKEFIRTTGYQRARAWSSALNLAIVPLFFLFGVILIIRFLAL